MAHKPVEFERSRIEDRRFQKVFNRRKREDVSSPRKETNIAFAARAAEKAIRTPSISIFSSRLRKV